jgi:hypothetical protein
MPISKVSLPREELRTRAGYRMIAMDIERSDMCNLVAKIASETRDSPKAVPGQAKPPLIM